MRDRRRTQTVHEIKAAMLAQLDDSGPGELSLRAVARAVGMTVQSIYHYFDSRNALLSELAADAHRTLAHVVQLAADDTCGRRPAERRLAATCAYRDWALTNRAAFLLLFGTPVPGFEPFVEGAEIEAALRLAAPFLEVIFDGWTPEQLAAVPLSGGGEPIARSAPQRLPLPPGAHALFYELRARMHGLVMLELLGHLRPFHGNTGALYVGAMNRMSSDVDFLQDTGARTPTPIEPVTSSVPT